MAIKLATIQDLLEQQEWEACESLVGRAFVEHDWSTGDKAFLRFAQCRSLSNLERYTQALEPGQLSVYLAEEARDYDLLGRSLLELAWVQHKIPGMERWAPVTQQRFFESFSRYKSIRDRYLSAMFNLGVYLRAAGCQVEAFDQFRATYTEARQRGEHPLAHLARSTAVWEALRLQRIAEAEALIEQGAEYQPADPRLRASHQLDLAQLALLKGNTLGAGEHALLAAVQCHEAPDLMARSLEILSNVADRSGDGDLAITAGILAKLQAESDDRHDTAAQVVGAIRSLALRYPEAVDRLMATLDGKK